LGDKSAHSKSLLLECDVKRFEQYNLQTKLPIHYNTVGGSRFEA
jgi:hypothetical protein